MDYPFLPQEKGASSYSPSPFLAQIDGTASMEVAGTGRGSVYEDPFNSFSELMGFDSSMAWCNSPSATDQMLASYGMSTSQPLPFACLDPFTFPEQHLASFCDRGDAFNPAEASCSHGEKMGLQQINSQLICPSNSAGSDALGDKKINVVRRQNLATHSEKSTIVPRSMSLSIEEKMLRALCLLKETSGGGILAQVWVPMRCGDQYYLTTSEQPYLLDQMLAGYREVSRAFTFSAEVKPGFPLGLPGRVFLSKVPEWTSNVSYYHDREYLRAKDALDHEVRGSIALPILEPMENSCCAVLELVTMKEKPDFDAEMENVCQALQAVNLRSTTHPRLRPQCLSKNQRAALAEISDVLHAVCHAHRLPLALTWIPCHYTEGAVEDIKTVHVREGSSTSSDGKYILCIESTACYVNDKEMEGFVRTCTEHYIVEGQGIAGKALQSNHPFLFPDVKTYDISEYPLVHHARKYGLQAAVAIRLRSTYTGYDDYILEFFLPVNITGSSELQLLLNNLSGTVQRICKSLRTVSDAELTGREDSQAQLQKGGAPSFAPVPISKKSSQMSSPEVYLNLIDKRPGNALGPKIDGVESDAVHEQATGGLRKQLDKKRSSAEKNVSLSVLQQYFSGSLKDAAKSIGVCPTTLKRICRQHGISRWPSRKINKVNRSLRKIQNVLESVQGVEGGLMFDATTGSFVAAGSFTRDSADPGQGFLFSSKEDQSVRNPANFMIKAEEDEYYIGTQSQTPEKSGFHVIDCGEDSRGIASVLGRQTDPGSGPSAFLDNTSAPPFTEQGQRTADNDSTGMKLDNVDCHLVSWSSSSFAAGEEIDTKMEGEDGVVDHNRPTGSIMTESSNGSGSMVHGSSSSSQSTEGRHSKAKTGYSYSGPHITVKATYKEDLIRFKFEPSAGCFHLYEEVAKRFKLQNGTFQLKYLDDEDEWVMLVSDSDLQECVEILDFNGKHSVKFLVHDVPFSMGSSGGSTCFLAG